MFFLSALKWVFNSEMCIIHSSANHCAKPSWRCKFATYLFKKSALNGSVPGFSVLDSTLFLLLVQIWSMHRAWLGTWKPDQPSGHIGHIGQCQVGSCTFGTFKASLHCATDPPPWPQVFSLSRSSSSQQSPFIQAGGSHGQS